MHLKVLWTALNVFSMQLGGNRRWVPLSFENNDNKKRYRADKFYFTTSSAVSSIPTRPPSPVWTTYCRIKRSSRKNCLFN